MAVQKHQQDAINRIDLFLREDRAEFTSVAVHIDGYYEWYSRLLGALALLAGDDAIVFGHTSYDSSADTGTLTVFTSNLVIQVQIAGAASNTVNVETRAISRSSLRAMGLAVSDRMETDQWDRPNHRWPGRVTLTLEYPALSEIVVLTVRGFDPHHRDETPAALQLIDALRGDLIAAA